MTLYDLKPRFQALLRPLANWLVSRGVTANQVTLAAIFLSVATGTILATTGNARLFILLPLALFVRMALNAIDGMIAREQDQKTTLGMFLNELGDVISDTALILPFVAIGFGPWGVVAFAIAAILSEFAGVLAIATGQPRRYDGPMGKSDRALALGLLAVVVAVGLHLPSYVTVAIFPILTLATLLTLANRVRKALDEQT